MPHRVSLDAAWDRELTPGPQIEAACVHPGAEQCAVLLRLLAAAMTPLVLQTHAWIASGVLQDPESEFFVMQGAAS